MERKVKIIKNAIRCKKCGEILESKTRHDFVACKCFRDSGGTEGCFCDGGTSYLRHGGDPEMYESLCETRLYTDEERDAYNEQQLRLAENYDGIYNIDLMV